MKKALLVAVIVLLAAWVGFCIADDARHGVGCFMSTATYREYVKEGKGGTK